MPRRSVQSAPKRDARSIIKEYLGEESATSDAEEDATFHSPSTDVGATRYSLDFTTANPSKQSKSTVTHKAAQKEPKNNLELQKSPTRGSQQHKNSSTEEDESDIDVEHDGTPPSPQVTRTSPRKQHVSPKPGTSNSRTKKTLTEPAKRTSRSQQHEDSTSGEEEEQIETSRRSSLRNRNDSSRPGPSRSPTKKTANKPLLQKVYKEIRSIHESKTLQIQKLPFSRVIREILMQYNRTDLYITPQALAALQESAEVYLTILFQDAYRCTLHRDRVTLQPKDVQLVRFLRGPQDPGN